MAGARIHLHLPLAAGLGWHREDDPSGRIGASQFDRWAAVGGDQADGGIAGRLTAGELTFQAQGVGEAREPLQAALDGVGPDLGGGHHKTHQADQPGNKKGLHP